MTDSGETGQPPGGVDPPGAAAPGSQPWGGGQPWGGTQPGGGPAWSGPAGPPPPPGGWNAPPPYAYEPAAPPGMYFDPVSGLMLPNGTALASVGRRIGAYFLSIVLAIVTLIIGYIIWGAIIWGRGQTPTYQVLGMRCYRPDTGRVAGWWWMALREVIGRAVVESLLGFITELVSLILFLATREHRALHDMVAGTVVLRDPNLVLG